MAVPSLIHKAALTLFHNPHMQPEDVSVPYGDFSPYVTVIQRSWRRRTFLHCYVHSVYDVLSKAYRVPVLPDFQPGHASTHSARARCVVVDATWVNTGGYLG